MSNKLNCDNVDTRSFISDGKYKRNIPSSSLENSYLTRPTQTRHVVMPMIDCRKPSTVKTLLHPAYKTDKIFNPGSRGPYVGYSNQVDRESQLKNMFHPLQKCSQNIYVPNSSSDLYKEGNYKNNLNHSFQHLDRVDRFKPFNPNNCNLGRNMFNNHTRQQTKDL
tara:strand:- start:12931 stop:13425 length:495 start_codon:yes stop_codon:yes gene_type:complete